MKRRTFLQGTALGALAGRLPAIATTALVGTVMLLFFIGACYLLRVRELHSIIDVVAGKLRRAA